MKLRYIIFILLFFNIVIAQFKNPLDKILTLHKSPQILDDNKIILIINELKKYGDAFKYSKELNNGNYEVDKNTNEYLLKILDGKKYKAIIKFIKLKNDKKNNSCGTINYDDNFYMENINDYFNFDRLEYNLKNKDKLNSSIFVVNPIYRQTLLNDEKILDGLGISGQTLILNRERTKSVRV